VHGTYRDLPSLRQVTVSCSLHHKEEAPRHDLNHPQNFRSIVPEKIHEKRHFQEKS
jgi:hypothetical protein